MRIKAKIIVNCRDRYKYNWRSSCKNLEFRACTWIKHNWKESSWRKTYEFALSYKVTRIKTRIRGIETLKIVWIITNSEKDGECGKSRSKRFNATDDCI